MTSTPEAISDVEMARAAEPRGRTWPNRVKTLFVIPALLMFTVVAIVPILTNFFYGFTDWNGFSATFDFVGLENIARAIVDPALIRAAVVTLTFTVVNAPLQLGLGLGLALSLHGSGRVRTVLRLVIVLPIAISGVVLGFLGTVIFDPRSGLLASVAHVPGLGWLSQNWLGDPALALGAVIAMNLWQWTGFTMLIFLAGLSTVPQELLEAAKIDGAGAWRRFRHVTWPLLAPTATINIVLTVIGGFKIFDIIYVLTKGGPAHATESVVFRVATQGAIGQFGYSSATNFLLTAAILIVSIALLTVLRRREVHA